MPSNSFVTVNHCQCERPFFQGQFSWSDLRLSATLKGTKAKAHVLSYEGFKCMSFRKPAQIFNHNCHREETNATHEAKLFASYFGWSKQQIVALTWIWTMTKTCFAGALQSSTYSNWSVLLIKGLSDIDLFCVFEKNKKSLSTTYTGVYRIDLTFCPFTAARKGLRSCMCASARLDVRMCMCV